MLNPDIKYYHKVIVYLHRQVLVVAFSTQVISIANNHYVAAINDLVVVNKQINFFLRVFIEGSYIKIKV